MRREMEEEGEEVLVCEETEEKKKSRSEDSPHAPEIEIGGKRRDRFCGEV